MNKPSALDCLKALRECGSKSKAAEALGIPRTTLRRRLDSLDDEIVAETVRLAKAKQRLQDQNRVQNKAFREHARVENAVAEYAKEIQRVLTDFKFSDPPRKPVPQRKATGIIHWSDQHLNERVNLPHNQYSWQVAAQRLKKHVDACKRLCDCYSVGSVLVAMTGDLLNSDRRLDELMANAGNRAKASVLAVDLYQQALRDLARDLDVTVAAISGNESRIPKEVGWNPEAASDNYDFVIFEHLKMLLNSTAIRFVDPVDPSEMVVDVGGQHVLLIHGHGAIGKDEQKSVQEIAGRYAARGVILDMVVWGHIHNANIGDRYARSSSLVGSNDFAEKALNLTGRASQNFYVLHKDGGFDGIKIDLQNTDGVEGYNLQARLEAYNTKSADKCHAAETIHRIVI
jgi:predicted phosphodiesterase/DNA-binding Lrp family transcriptional regulator